MSRIERSNEKYNRAMVKKLIALDAMEPEASFDNVEDMLAWLNGDDAVRASDRPRSRSPRTQD